MIELDEYSDKTFSELVDDDETDLEENDVEEFKNQGEDFMRLAQIIFAAEMLGEMFVNDEITFGEYYAMIDYLEKQDADIDATLI